MDNQSYVMYPYGVRIVNWPEPRKLLSLNDVYEVVSWCRQVIDEIVHHDDGSRSVDEVHLIERVATDETYVC